MEAPTVEERMTNELRSACDWCAQRKKACNGAFPCQPCKAKGMECTYSIKKRRGPPKGTKYRRRQPKGEEDASRKRPAPVTISTSDTASSGDEDTFPYPEEAALVAARPPPMPRVTLSPSMATGLMGILENRFLASCLQAFGGLVPVSDEGGIRKAMVGMISELTAGGSGVVASAPFGGMAAAAAAAAADAGPENDDARRDAAASAALLWATVCLGAIVEGSAEFMGYIKATHEALRTARCIVTPECCRAYLLLATAHCMMGDMQRFARYVTTAHKIYRALPESCQEGSLRAAVAVYAHLLSDPMAAPEKYEPQLMAYTLPVAGARRLNQFQLVQVFTGAETLYTKGWLLQRRAEDAGEVIGRFTGPLYEMFIHNDEVLRILELAADTIDASAYPSSAMSVTGTRAWLAFRHALAGDVSVGTKFATEAAEALVAAYGCLRWEPWWHYAHVLCFVLSSGAGTAAYARLRAAHNAVTSDAAHLLPEHPADLDPMSCCDLDICQDMCQRIRFNVLSHKALLLQDIGGAPHWSSGCGSVHSSTGGGSGSAFSVHSGHSDGGSDDGFAAADAGSSYGGSGYSSAGDAAAAAAATRAGTAPSTGAPFPARLPPVLPTVVSPVAEQKTVSFMGVRVHSDALLLAQSVGWGAAASDWSDLPPAGPPPASQASTAGTNGWADDVYGGGGGLLGEPYGSVTPEHLADFSGHRPGSNSPGSASAATYSLTPPPASGSREGEKAWPAGSLLPPPLAAAGAAVAPAPAESTGGR